MFTGIVTHIGRVRRISGSSDLRMELDADFSDGDIGIGSSVACSGVCLTVVDERGGWFAVTVSRETLACTTLGQWRVGTTVNLECALKIGNELGGHLVSGHVDGVARLADASSEGESVRMLIDVPDHLTRFVAPKGSVTLDGVSLTVNDVDGERVSVNIIPHTLRATTLGQATRGQGLNLEVDMLARYVTRLLEKD